MALRCALLLCAAGQAAAFSPSTGARLARPSLSGKAVQSRPQMASGFDSTQFETAMEGFGETYPDFYKRGLGPSVWAEKWNGRHAMFGWMAIVITGYAKSHGLFPEGDVALTYAEWGSLATVGFGDYITNERAVIMVAHMHALALSSMAAMLPLPFSDPLLIPRGQEDTKPYGYFPAFKPGLTEECEMLNGRLAMIGLIATCIACAFTGTSILDATNWMVGGMLYK